MSTPSEVPCNWWTEWSGRVANRLLQPSNPTKLECWGDLIADILQWWDTNNHICALLKKKAPCIIRRASSRKVMHDGVLLTSCGIVAHFNVAEAGGKAPVASAPSEPQEELEEARKRLSICYEHVQDLVHHLREGIATADSLFSEDSLSDLELLTTAESHLELDDQDVTCDGADGSGGAGGVAAQQGSQLRIQAQRKLSLQRDSITSPAYQQSRISRTRSMMAPKVHIVSVEDDEGEGKGRKVRSTRLRDGMTPQYCSVCSAKAVHKGSGKAVQNGAAPQYSFVSSCKAGRKGDQLAGQDSNEAKPLCSAIVSHGDGKAVQGSHAPDQQGYLGRQSHTKPKGDAGGFPDQLYPAGPTESPELCQSCQQQQQQEEEDEEEWRQFTQGAGPQLQQHQQQQQEQQEQQEGRPPSYGSLGQDVAQAQQLPGSTNSLRGEHSGRQDVGRQQQQQQQETSSCPTGPDQDTQREKSDSSPSQESDDVRDLLAVLAMWLHDCRECYFTLGDVSRLLEVEMSQEELGMARALLGERRLIAMVEALHISWKVMHESRAEGATASGVFFFMSAKAFVEQAPPGKQVLGPGPRIHKYTWLQHQPRSSIWLRAVALVSRPVDYSLIYNNCWDLADNVMYGVSPRLDDRLERIANLVARFKGFLHNLVHPFSTLLDALHIYVHGHPCKPVALPLPKPPVIWKEDPADLNPDQQLLLHLLEIAHGDG